jgi:hypothetical protein
MCDKLTTAKASKKGMLKMELHVVADRLSGCKRIVLAPGEQLGWPLIISVTCRLVHVLSKYMGL